MIKGRDNFYRCIYCGKYVSYREITLQRVKIINKWCNSMWEDYQELYHKICKLKQDGLVF